MDEEIKVGGWWAKKVKPVWDCNTDVVYERACVVKDNIHTSNAVTMRLFTQTTISMTNGTYKNPAITLDVTLPVGRTDLREELAGSLARVIDRFMVEHKISPEFRKLTEEKA